MKCSLCGFEFEESESMQVCKGCMMTGNCKLIRCPNCGYEWPKEPGWAKIFRRKERKNDKS